MGERLRNTHGTIYFQLKKLIWASPINTLVIHDPNILCGLGMLCMRPHHSLRCFCRNICSWDLILVQYQYNNCTTTPYMRVDPSMWDPPSCEELLYSCCIGVVNLTFSNAICTSGAQHEHNTPSHRSGPQCVVRLKCK
jgi:hypothetical protein